MLPASARTNPVTTTFHLRHKRTFHSAFVADVTEAEETTRTLGASFRTVELGVRLRGAATNTGYTMEPRLRTNREFLTACLQRMTNHCNQLYGGSIPGRSATSQVHQCFSIFISTLSAFFVDEFSQPPTGIRLNLRMHSRLIIPFMSARLYDWRRCDDEAIRSLIVAHSTAHFTLKTFVDFLREPVFRTFLQRKIQDALGDDAVLVVGDISRPLDDHLFHILDRLDGFISRSTRLKNYNTATLTTFIPPAPLPVTAQGAIPAAPLTAMAAAVPPPPPAPAPMPQAYEETAAAGSFEIFEPILNAEPLSRDPSACGARSPDAFPWATGEWEVYHWTEAL